MKHKIYLILMVCLLPYFLMGSPHLELGTLIVSFQMEKQNEKINRVRFWLKNEQNKQTMYPKGTAYVDDKVKNSRMVVIEDLRPGKYTLEFLIPNLDGKFEETSVREVLVAKGEVVKIDQEIRTKKHSQTHVAVSASSEKELPTEDPEEEYSRESLNAMIEPSASEKVENKKDERISSTGRLIVSYELKENVEHANQILFRLIQKDGDHLYYPRQGQDMIIPLQSGRMIMVQDVPSGNYELEFYVENSNEPLATLPVTIEKSRTKSIHKAISYAKPLEEEDPLPKKPETVHLPSLTFIANIPTAEFQLTNMKTQEVFEKMGREATFEDLTPGTYEASFFSYDPFFIPPKKETILLEPKTEITKEIAYMTLGKIKLTINIPLTTVSITPMHSGQSVIKKEIDHGEATFYLPEGKYRMTFRDEGNHIAPKPFDIDVKSLQTSQVNALYKMNDANLRN